MSNGQSSIQLSKRELQVLEMVVTGASNQEIAHKLVISINTVKVHMRNIFEKLEVQSRTEATLKAIQEGLVAVENESDSKPEIETKTFLLTPNPALTLPRWQQIYLLLAALVALIIAIIPFIPQASSPTIPDLPVRYLQPTPPAPIQSNGNSGQWATHAAMPTGRAGLALVAHGGQIFAIGGVRGNNQATRSVEIFDPLTNSWKEGASKLVATANIGGAVIDNKIYVPGGCTNDGQAIDTMEIYDPVSDTWTKAPLMPGVRCGYGLTAFQDQLYLFGGWNGETFEDTIFVYSPQQDGWQLLENTALPRPMGFMGAAVFDETIYLVGGYDGETELDTTYTFDPSTETWSEKAHLQEKRGGLGLIAGGGSLFAIGGGWLHPLETSEKYNSTTDSWESFETPFKSQWRNLGLTTIDGKIYAVGGWDGTEEKYIDSVVSHQFLYQIFLPISTFNNQQTPQSNGE